MRVHSQATMIAIAMGLLVASGPNWAHATAAQEDGAQLTADQAALAREKVQSTTDQAALRRDRAEGRMSAESLDALRVYHDQEDIRGMKKDLAADRGGSLQAVVDRRDLKDERQAQMADETTLRQDAAHGRMAATSPDAERVYRDQRAVRGQEQAIAADQSRLAADVATK